MSYLHEEIVERIPENPDVLAFSAMFSGDWPIARDLIRLARSRFPNALFIAGGEHVTALTEYSLHDCPEIDVCVRGEGEYPLYEVLEAWRQDGDFRRVSGIAFLDNGRYVVNGDLPRIRDIDGIPWPSWPDGYLEKFWAQGKSYGTLSNRDTPMVASRGCLFRCTFCSSPQMWTTRHILRDVDDLIAEIKHWVDKYKITSLQFYDLAAVTKKRWTIEFCKKMLEHGIRLQW